MTNSNDMSTENTGRERSLNTSQRVLMEIPLECKGGTVAFNGPEKLFDWSMKHQPGKERFLLVSLPL